MVKTFKNLLLQNLKSYNLETSHVSSKTRAHYKVHINDDPVLTLSCFIARLNLASNAFKRQESFNENFQQMTK